MDQVSKPKRGNDLAVRVRKNRPSPDAQSLAVLGHAKWTLENTTDVHVAKQIRDTAESLRRHFRSTASALAKEDHVSFGEISELKARVTEAFTIRQRAAEVKLRAERRLGQLLGGCHLRGGDRRSKMRQANSQLQTWGISKDQSRRCQRIASIHEADFESYIANQLRQDLELTSAELLRLAARVAACETECITRRFRPDFAGVKERLARLVKQGVTVSCVFISPPWPAIVAPPLGCASDFEAETTRRFFHALRTLPVPEVCAPRAHLHLRTPWEWHFRAAKILHGWGFTCRSAAVIPVRPRAYGDYWRTAYDLLLLGVRGRLSFRDTSVVGWLGSHSDLTDAPDADICEAIARVSPGPYLTVLGTDCPAGWTAVTDE